MIRVITKNLKLFNLGNVISGAPIIKGNIKLPKPPIKDGIIIKNIIINACAVIIVLYVCESNNEAGLARSNFIKIDVLTPIIPTKEANIKYNIPISLWEVENNHLL